jgi:hypothetical protein
MKALHMRKAAAILVPSLVVLVPATAVAETKTYTFNISGTEVSATSTTGRFVGTASGSARGTWYAEVNHDPLGASPASIRPGGSFGMALHQAKPAYLVSGQFSGGTISVNNSGARCTNQVYGVDGYLRNVSVTGTGHVVATLTHHRKSVLGRCWLYAATVSGTSRCLDSGPVSQSGSHDYELSAAVNDCSGRVRSGGIGNHPPRLGLVRSAGAVAAGGAVGLPALATALTVAGVAVGAFGAADDRPGPGGWPASVAFAVQLDHHVGAQGGVLLVAADPLIQLGR